jgi:hypothetical protein
MNIAAFDRFIVVQLAVLKKSRSTNPTHKETQHAEIPAP